MFEMPDERFVFGGVSEHGRERQFVRGLGPEPHIGIATITAVAENLSGIKEPSGIEGILDLLHDGVELIAELVADEFGARDPDSVFAGQRSFELPHERGDILHDLPELFQIGRGVQIKDRPHMEQAGGGMSVKARFQLQGTEETLQS
ncbi:MAG TPA: hypothetical protein VNM37_22595, partial [Candidatus Dormibacteraeota bacterium]|nr:hypothetical protein [Candidatus Dormibacteraeota bacterium]